MPRKRAPRKNGAKSQAGAGAENQVTVNIEMPTTGFPPTLAANYVQVSHIADQVELALSWLNLREMVTLVSAARAGGNKNPKSTVDAAHVYRFGLTVQTFKVLKRKVDEIHSKIEEAENKRVGTPRDA